LSKFEIFDFHPAIIKATDALGFDTPTPIQQQGIPLVLAGVDVMGLAQTGTGKTAAFGLPIVQQLLQLHDRPASKTARALILAPTRELANQIASNLRDYVRHTHLKVNVVVGGASIQVQRQKLGRGTDILVATPGRLLDLVGRKAIHLDKVKFLVLDEADQMLDLGFINVLKDIASMLGTPRQTLLFSATMPKSIEELSRAFQDNPKRIEVSPVGKAADKITQKVHFIGNRTKADLLKDLLAENKDDLSLVFCRTKHGAEKLKKHLVERDFKADSIHGNKSQGQRDRAIRGFKSGETRVLVATDVAARGIDISGVSHVYNFDLPEVAENYVHRIGRTARAGASGEAVAFCSPAEIRLLRSIEKLMGIKIEVASGEMSADEERENLKKLPKKRNRNRPKNRKTLRDGKPAKNSERGERRKKRDGEKPASFEGNRDNAVARVKKKPHRKNMTKNSFRADKDQSGEGAKEAGFSEYKSFSKPKDTRPKRVRPNREKPSEGDASETNDKKPKYPKTNRKPKDRKPKDRKPKSGFSDAANQGRKWVKKPKRRVEA